VRAYALREEFYRYIPIEVPTETSTHAFLKERVADALIEIGDGFTFALELRENSRVIGAVRIDTSSVNDRAASIGYGLNPDYWKRGYMSEAVKAVLAFGFGQMRMHRIWATVDPDNEASWRLLERLGMHREGLLRDEKLLRGTWRDSYLYAIVATRSNASLSS